MQCWNESDWLLIHCQPRVSGMFCNALSLWTPVSRQMPRNDPSTMTFQTNPPCCCCRRRRRPYRPHWRDDVGCRHEEEGECRMELSTTTTHEILVLQSTQKCFYIQGVLQCSRFSFYFELGLSLFENARGEEPDRYAIVSVVQIGRPQWKSL